MPLTVHKYELKLRFIFVKFLKRKVHQVSFMSIEKTPKKKE